MRKMIANYKKNHKLSDVAANIAGAIFSVIFVWTMVSFFDIVAHNMSDGMFWRYNLIILACGM